MKKLIFVGIVLVSTASFAYEEANYGLRFKQEATRFITGMKLVGKELYTFMHEKLVDQQGKKESVVTTQYSEKKSSAVIVESCEYCNHLCSNDVSEEHFA